MMVLEYIASGIGIIGVAVVVWGVIRGLVELLATEFFRFRGSKRKTPGSTEKIRMGIGFHLLLGLEFLIAADIVRTIIEPTLEELGILGAIVAIRIALAYFLGKEIAPSK